MIGTVRQRGNAWAPACHDQIMILDAGDRAPGVVKTGRVKRGCNGRYGNGCIGSARGCPNGTSQRTAQVVMLHHVKARAAGRRRCNDGQRGRGNVGEFSRPKLGILQDPRRQAAQLRRERAAEFPSAALVRGQQDADFVVAESVRVKFLDVVCGIIRQISAHVGVPKRKRETAGAPVLVGKVQAVVIVADIRNPVEIVNAVIV